MDPGIADVSDTALWIAAYRARETERTDALFQDPLAARLTGDRGRELARKMTGAEQFEWMTVVRTFVIDRYLQEAIARGVDTVVNLGAGLDTRPYRMTLPASLSWIEVDMPKIVALKETASRARRRAAASCTSPPTCPSTTRGVRLSRSASSERGARSSLPRAC